MKKSTNLPMKIRLKPEHIGKSWNDYKDGNGKSQPGVAEEILRKYSGSRGGKLAIIDYDGKPTFCVGMEAKAGPGASGTTNGGHIVSYFPEEEGLIGEDGKPAKVVHATYWVKWDELFRMGWGGKFGVSITMGNYKAGENRGLNALMLAPMMKAKNLNASRPYGPYENKYPHDEEGFMLDAYLYHPDQLGDYGDHNLCEELTYGKWYKIELVVKQNTWTESGEMHKNGFAAIAVDGQVKWKYENWAIFNKEVTTRLGFGSFFGGQNWMYGKGGDVFYRFGDIDETIPPYFQGEETGPITLVEPGDVDDGDNDTVLIETPVDIIHFIEEEVKNLQNPHLPEYTVEELLNKIKAQEERIQQIKEAQLGGISRQEVNQILNMLQEISEEQENEFVALRKQKLIVSRE